MTETERDKIWKEGFEAGARTVRNQENKAIKIGNAILEVMYETFQTATEED